MSILLSPDSERVFKHLTETADEAQREPAPVPEGWTVRDEANVLTAFAFRNSFLESLHAGAAGFSDAEMRKLMIETSARLAQLLFLARKHPGWYAVFLLEYGHMYCRGWERVQGIVEDIQVQRMPCGRCTISVQLGWAFCPTCGAPQSGEQAASGQPPSAEASSP